MGRRSLHKSLTLRHPAIPSVAWHDPFGRPHRFADFSASSIHTSLAGPRSKSQCLLDSPSNRTKSIWYNTTSSSRVQRQRLPRTPLSLRNIQLPKPPNRLSIQALIRRTPRRTNRILRRRRQFAVGGERRLDPRSPIQHQLREQTRYRRHNRWDFLVLGF
jgi:hypothetical protein